MIGVRSASKPRRRRFVFACLAAAVFHASSSAAHASALEHPEVLQRDGSFDRQLKACAAFDLHISAAIEQSDGVDRLSARAAEAAFQILAARRLCREGRFAEALEIYTRMDADFGGRWLK